MLPSEKRSEREEGRKQRATPALNQLERRICACQHLHRILRTLRLRPSTSESPSSSKCHPTLDVADLVIAPRVTPCAREVGKVMTSALQRRISKVVSRRVFAGTIRKHRLACVHDRPCGLVAFRNPSNTLEPHCTTELQLQKSRVVSCLASPDFPPFPPSLPPSARFPL